jgi:single-strand DNA-binding protein
MIMASIYGRCIRIKAIQTKSGKPMAVGTVAVNLECRGSDEPETEWIGLVCFGKHAEHLETLPDGTMVSAMGRIQINKFTDKESNERRSLQLIADHIITAKSTRPNAGRKKADNQPATAGPMEYYARGGAEDREPLNDEVPL